MGDGSRPQAASEAGQDRMARPGDPEIQVMDGTWYRHGLSRERSDIREPQTLRGHEKRQRALDGTLLPMHSGEAKASSASDTAVELGRPKSLSLGDRR